LAQAVIAERAVTLLAEAVLFGLASWLGVMRMKSKAD
jgi:hypothetical protein